MALVEGVLVWDEERQNLLARWIREKDGEALNAIVLLEDLEDVELAEAFARNPLELDGRSVELTPASRGNSRRASSIRARLTADERRTREQTNRQAQANEAAARRHQPGLFNPYAFVPAPGRNQLTLNGPLGDHEPASHGHYADDRWSGAIRVRLKTHTPLLLRRHVKSYDVEGKEHRVYEVPRLPPTRSKDGSEPAGQPDLHPASLKGMLSVAYEALTNSRMRVFDYREPLTQRLLQQETGELIPVRVIGGADGGLTITEMRQVRLPVQLIESLRHGDPLRFTTIATNGPGGPTAGSVEKITDEEVGDPDGWAVITGHNPNLAGPAGKRYEMIFTHTGGRVHQLNRSPARAIEDRWTAVVSDTFHASRQPGAIHVVGGWLLTHEENTHLRKILARDGFVLCWARKAGNEIEQLVPNRYGRVTHPLSPFDVLPDSLRPASSRFELSPADRVFGWSADRPGAVGRAGAAMRHRGQLAVCRVRLASDPALAISSFEGDGILLPPLASPKPNQVLFYGAQDSRGTPWNDRSLRDARAQTYKPGGGIRGRKVYPARNGSSFRDAYPPSTAAARTALNSTIRSWVNPGVTFEFELRVINLSTVELGALLWLLTRPQDHRMRLGGGRPLGFGEVHLSCVEARVRTGAQTRERLLRLAEDAAPSSGEPLANPAELADQFEQIAPVETRCALEAAMRGYPADSEVSYPHLPESDQAHHWFAENQGDRAGQYALPALEHPELIQNLPLDPSH